MQNQIVLSKIEVKKNRIDYFCDIPSCLKNFFDEEERFYIEYPKEFDFDSVPESVLSIPFVMNILPFVWLSQSMLLVEELDEAFYYSVDEIRRGFEKIHGKDIFGGNLVVKKVIKNTYTATDQSCVLFSGGVDALSALINHIEKKPVLINVWGADLKLDDISGHDVINDKLSDLARKLNLEYFYVKSSLRYFYNTAELEEKYGKIINDTWWHGMQHSIGMLSLLAPYDYLKKCKCNIIASSYTERTCIDKQRNQIIPCSNYPFIDESLKMLSVEVIHDGFELSRMDKLKDIVSFFGEKDDNISLQVCFRPLNGNNCCYCEKCYRTMAALCALGADPNGYGFEYSAKVEKRMKRFLSLNMLDGNVLSFWEEISEYIKQNHSGKCRWLGEYTYNTGYRWYKRAYKKIREMARKVIKSFLYTINS